MDEITLAKLAIDGNEEAQIQILHLYKDALYRVAYSYLHHEQDALDAVSETTFLALKNMHKVQSPQFFKTWLVRIVINTSLSIKRKQEPIILADLSDETYVRQQDTMELDEFISKLTIEQQQLIFLKYFQDLKNSEIAKIQNISEGTVKSRLYYTLRKLKTFFKEGDVS